MSNKRILIKNGKALIDETGKVLVSENTGGSATIKTKGTWQGTSVENGYVENVYLNTNLSVEEVVDIIESANLTYEASAYVLTAKTDQSLIIGIMNHEGILAIGDFATGQIYFHNTDIEEIVNEFGFTKGWNPNVTMPIAINGEIMSMGENAKFTSLVSTTPFTYQEGTPIELSGEYDGSTVEITDLSGSWQGTTVPIDQMVEKVYVNTSLSNKEVIAILETLTYVPYLEGTEIWACFSDTTLTNTLAIVKAGGGYEIKLTINGTTQTIFDDFTTWNSDFNGIAEFNMDNLLSVVAPQLNFIPENEKASILFSTTPFTKSEPNTIDIKKYLENKQLPLNIKVNVESSGSGGGGSEEYPSEAIAYYKQTRNKNYPYFPLPYEMEETQDTIYMLYGASGYMCCPVFKITFTECVCTIQKYMNTTLVSEYVENVTSGTTKYLQFSEEDSDYSTYNYIVIKLQGSITSHYLNYSPMFNGVLYNSSSSSELIEVSGKCNSCDIKVVNNSYKYHQNLEYYSFLGVSTTSMNYMFVSCYSLQTIPQLDTSKVTTMYNMFNSCFSLQTIPQLDTSNVTSMSDMFNGCSALTSIPQLDTSKVTSMNNMFSSCRSLQTIPQLDTSKVTSMNNMFSYCYSLQTIPLLDTSKVTSMNNMFSYCYILCKLDIINMKVSFSLSYSTMLTANELVKILNNLATVTTTQTLTLGSTNLAKLTEEDIAIAQNKGWSVA